jgi:hypothetical protein
MTFLTASQGRAVQVLLAMCVATWPLLAVAASPPFNDFTRPYIGTSVAVMLGSAVGAIGAFAYHPEPKRRKMFAMGAINMCLGAAATVLLPLAMGWQWMTPEVRNVAEPPLGLLLSFASRWIVPVFIEHGPALLKGYLQRRSGGAPSPGEKP